MQLTATLLMDSKLKAQLKKVLTELGDFRFLPVSQLGQFVFMDAEHANVIKKKG